MKKRGWGGQQLALLRTQQIDGFLYVHRSALAWTLVAAIFTVVISILFTLGGFAWKQDPFPPVTLFDEATVLLAMGTLALAFAALVQAESGVETVNARYKPNFELAWEPPSVTDSEPGRLTPGRNLVFRNLGPGDARMVGIMLYVYRSGQDANAHFDGKQPIEAQPFFQEMILPSITVDAAPVELVPAMLIPAPNQSEAVVEISGRTVFDRLSALRVYRLTGVWVTRAPRGLDAWLGGPPTQTLIWQVVDWTTWQPWEVKDLPLSNQTAV